MFRFVSFFPILSVLVFLKWVGVGILFYAFAMHIPFSVTVASPQWLFSLHFVALLSSESIRLPASSTRASTHPHPQSFGPHCLFWHTFHFSVGCAGLWEVGGDGEAEIVGWRLIYVPLQWTKKSLTFSRDLVSFWTLLHCSIASVITISLPRPRLTLEKYCYSENHLAFLKRYPEFHKCD